MLTYERIPWSSVWHEWRPTDQWSVAVYYNRSWRLPDYYGRLLDGPLPVPITSMDSCVHLGGGKQSITRHAIPWELFSCGYTLNSGEIEKNLANIGKNIPIPINFLTCFQIFDHIKTQSTKSCENFTLIKTSIQVITTR